MEGIPIAKLIMILRAIKFYAPNATISTDMERIKIIRINYNGPKYLENMKLAHVEAIDDVNLYDGYAEVNIP